MGAEISRNKLYLQVAAIFVIKMSAYGDAGFCELNIAEWVVIGITPDVDQMAEGFGQITDVMAECGPVKPFTNFITTPLSRGIRELNSMYNNFLQRSILQQLR